MYPPEVGGKWLLTASVVNLPEETKAMAIGKMVTFTDFTEDNDPRREHDFGSFDVDGHKFFWKIDYYDRDLKYGSEDPADPTKTTRVLTLMLAEDY
jgi:hypothetical protein